MAQAMDLHLAMKESGSLWPSMKKNLICAPENALHPERYYPHARIRVFHHSAPEIPETAFIFPMLSKP